MVGEGSRNGEARDGKGLIENERMKRVRGSTTVWGGRTPRERRKGACKGKKSQGADAVEGA